MKEIYANGWRSFKLIMDFENYTNKERMLKGFLMPFILLINAILFVLISVFYLIERLFANVFRVFIKIQSALFQKRMLLTEGKKRLMTFLAVVIFILFSPFILVYYTSMGLKTMGKILMKKLVFKVDFTRHYTVTDVYVFDDANVHTTQKVSGMMKDLNQSQALGQALESIMNEQNDPKNRRR
ncbi:MAG: hypothetical protein ACQEQA_02550 [Bacillota bacterium]